jgi:dolichyl-phosphate beta-glucosyltransferase
VHHNSTSISSKVSFVLPVYNCENELKEGLPVFIDYLESFLQQYEIIVVDDGSSNAQAIAGTCKQFKCIYIRNEVNCGKGHALRSGVSKASGTIILFMDGDFPFELQSIEKMINILVEGKADITIGDRTLPGSIVSENLTALRKLASNVLSSLLTIFKITEFRDTQCGLKGFTSNVSEEVFPLLKEDRFGFDIELIHIAQKKGMRIITVPVKVIDQKSSSVNVLRDGWNIFKLTLSLFLRNKKGI